MALMAGSVAAAPVEESKLERFMAADGKWAWRDLSKAAKASKEDDREEPAKKGKGKKGKKDPEPEDLLFEEE